MVDTILTIRQVEDIFQALTLRMLGLDPAAPVNQSRVRLTWPAKGAPAWKQGEDVIFLMIGYDDDLISRQMEVTYTEAGADTVNRTAAYTRVLRVNWILYGPNSFDDADTIRCGLFLPEIVGALAVNNLAPIVDIPLPARAPELLNGQWWDRSSVYCRFNELVLRQREIPTLQSAEVRVIRD